MTSAATIQRNKETVRRLLDEVVTKGDVGLIDELFTEGIAEGDMVALRATDRGTHDSEFMGLPPTGRKVEYLATAFFRFEDGRIAERWVQPDLFGLMKQLGGSEAADV